MPQIRSRAVERYEPKADAAAMVASGQARFTVLTPALVRMEFDPEGRFEDRASFAFVNRRLPVPVFTVTRHDGRLVIQTEMLKLTYVEGSGAFDAKNLMVRLVVGGEEVTWTPGTPDTGNLKGTVRTLDGVSGSCPLEPGLLSRDGWVVVDDSARVLFDDHEHWPWATARESANRGATDWYFFGHGRDYKAALRDFVAVAGRIPVPPRYVLGVWWSRYWAYTDQELKDLVAQFERHDVPLDVLVIDMDWHLDGWTGYTWNPRYFPDADGFLGWCREKGLRTTLNLHPADGVGKHEAQFRAMAAEMGVNTREVYRVPFDCTDRAFVEAYFKLLHHPIERQGVDFWWMDWQQGRTTKIPGLDPLPWLNYLHWTDMERGPEERLVKGREDYRPLIFSRWGTLGNHRYQIGFSGDTYNDWESLAFQPPFTATAANVGYGYWSHDIGGHQPGPVAPELYARWIQYGVFSPVLRTHAGKRPDAERRIWAFPEPVFSIAREMFHLRYALAPYVYTACRLAYDTGVSLCRPMYYEWPELEEAYAREAQYFFGEDLVAAPVARPADAVSGCAEADVWVPPGRWTEWFTGATFDGGQAGAVIRMLAPLHEFPLLARDGAVIPMAPRSPRIGQTPADPLILEVFPGQSGSTRVYEDDGLTQGYQRGACTWTPVSHRSAGANRHITIGAAEGAFPGMLKERRYEIRLRESWPAGSVSVNGRALEPLSSGQTKSMMAGWWYDEARLAVVIRTPSMPTSKGVEVVVGPAAQGMELGDGVLRAGLRGQLNLIDELVALLGDAAPKGLREAAAIRGLIATDPRSAHDRAAALQEGWWSLVEAVNGCHADSAAKASALARLLGFSCRMTVSGAGDGELQVTADVAYAPRFGGDHAVNAAIAFECAPSWTVTMAAGGAEERLGVGDHSRALARLKPVGLAQFGTVSASVTVREDGASFTLASHESVYPSISAWWVIGPFECPHNQELRPVFPPEQGVDLKASYPAKLGKAAHWQRVERPMAPGADPRGEFFVDLQRVLKGPHDHVVAYALTHLHSDRDTDAVLAIGSDDGVVAWLNGVEVHRNHIQRGYATREDKVAVRLRAGSNTLLLKIGQAEGGWGFCVHVEDAKGRPLPGVRISLES